MRRKYHPITAVILVKTVHDFATPPSVSLAAITPVTRAAVRRRSHATRAIDAARVEEADDPPQGNDGRPIAKRDDLLARVEADRDQPVLRESLVGRVGGPARMPVAIQDDEAPGRTIHLDMRPQGDQESSVTLLSSRGSPVSETR